MPKPSKRRRQLKEIHGRKGEEGDASNNEEETEDHIEVDDKGKTNKTVNKGNNIQPVSNTSSSQERVWVQCNYCDKWRSLPPTVDPGTLPEIWTCSLNTYDTLRMSCDDPEEAYNKEEEQQQVPIKSFLRLWVKRLKTADRAENRLASSTVTRQRKRKSDVEWIKCCNSSCGKWRAMSKGIESTNLLRRLYKNKGFGDRNEWYCSMNSWDESTASCAAPQEPLWNCDWNINS